MPLQIKELYNIRVGKTFYNYAFRCTGPGADKLREWCYNEFNEVSSSDFTIRLLYGQVIVCLNREEDAMAFKLIWVGD